MACPIHRSDNPTTFSVLDDEYWYCFVCQKGGTAVELLAALEGISRSEAAEKLGLELEHWQLRTSAYDLGKKLKGMSKTVLAEIEPPAGLENTFPFPLRDLHWPTVHYWELRSCNGGTYFPFRDLEGRLVGWSVRQAEGVIPKYLNSPGLRKSAFLYGLYENQERIKTRREAILVEGQFDALAVWDAGFPWVCSTLGCNFSRDQARLLLPWVDRIKVLYDGDKAGREGAFELKCKWQNVFAVELLYLPDGEDPCSAGPEVLEKILGG